MEKLLTEVEQKFLKLGWNSITEAYENLGITPFMKVVHEYCIEKCELQKQICADNADADYTEHEGVIETYVLKESILQCDNAVEQVTTKFTLDIVSLLEEWILNHPDDTFNKPYITSRKGNTYTLKDVLEGIRKGNELGKMMEKNILLLIFDLLTRDKRQIED